MYRATVRPVRTWTPQDKAWRVEVWGVNAEGPMGEVIVEVEYPTIELAREGMARLTEQMAQAVGLWATLESEELRANMEREV